MIIERLDGTQINIESLGVRRLFHRIPSLAVEHLTEYVDGRGEMVVGTQYRRRVISTTLMYKVRDIYSYYLIRDELNALFVQNEPFYIIFKRECYKRYKVRLAQQLEIEPAPRMTSFDVDFIMDDNFAESIGTSIDLHNRKEWDVDLWGFGLGIDWDKQYNYQFATNEFVVDNVGNVTIDPREHQLEITLKGTFGSYVKITNATTGDVYQYNSALASTDTLKITGVRTLKNSLSDFKNTNKQLLTLAPGDNQIIIEGGTVENVAFDFRFLYK